MGGKPKAGNTIHSEANSSIVSSVEHRKCHSQPGRHRRSFSGSSLAHHVALLVPLSGSIDPVVDRRGFTGSAKDRLSRKADLAIYSPVSGVSVWC